MSLLAMK
ncbi:hypothetical protein LINPERHAP2_LOCUS23119 [Linum perenne]